MNTINENLETTISEITERYNNNHKPSVTDRKSVRPTTSLKRSSFKVKSLRLGKSATRKIIKEDLSKLEESKI